MQKFKKLLERLIEFANKNIYSALFLLLSIAAIIIAKDYTQDGIYIFKDIKASDIEAETTFMYMGAEQSTADGKTIRVRIDDAGVLREYSTEAKTVSELFKDKNIKIGIYDYVVPFGNSALADGMTVYITRIDYITETIETKIPFDTVINDVDTVLKGTTVVATEGQEGLLVDTVAVKTVNGVKTDERKVVSSTLVKEPVTCIKEHGIGGKFRAPNGKVYNYLYRRECVATAYYDAYNRGKVATGHATVPGIVAVDKKVIPLHSRVYVVGKAGDFGILKAEDVGNFRGDWIDIYFETIEECFLFGRQKMTVYVLELYACNEWVHDPAKTQDIGYPGPNWKYSKKDKEENNTDSDTVEQE